MEERISHVSRYFWFLFPCMCEGLGCKEKTSEGNVDTGKGIEMYPLLSSALSMTFVNAAMLTLIDMQGYSNGTSTVLQ